MSQSVEARPAIQGEAQSQPIESIRVRRSPWEFRLPLAPDGKPQWLGLNGNEMEACLRDLKKNSRDFRRATK